MEKKIFTKIKDINLIAERHNQIADAALKLFSKKGYYETTLRELSDESGIGLGNLYNYIQKKTDILFILYNRVIEYFLICMKICPKKI